MHELTARHRRKAGSGPPATALIAWIGTEPHPRSGTRSGRHRWHTKLPRPANTRSAAAAVAACFLLVCGAILGITATISDEFLLPRQASTPSGWDQNSAAAPSSQGASPVPSAEITPKRRCAETIRQTPGKGTDASRRRASWACPKVGRQASQPPWRTVINRTSECLLRALQAGR